MKKSLHKHPARRLQMLYVRINGIERRFVAIDNSIPFIELSHTPIPIPSPFKDWGIAAMEER